MNRTALERTVGPATDQVATSETTKATKGREPSRSRGAERRIRAAVLAFLIAVAVGGGTCQEA